jgi:hypothetical protein
LHRSNVIAIDNIIVPCTISVVDAVSWNEMLTRV